MRRRAVTAVAVAVLLVAACGEASEATGGDNTWAAEAEDVVALLADAYDIADPYQTARFFTAGGTLDLTVWDLGIATTPDEVVQAVRSIWFTRDEGYADVRADHLFVSRDSALVWWSAYGEGGGSTWVQSYSFGRRGQTASKAFRNVEGTEERDTPEELAAEALVARYLAAWEGKDLAALTALYSPAVVVLDNVSGEEWRNTDELLGSLEEAPPLQAGPAPGIFTYQAGQLVEVVVLVQLGSACPRLEARRLVLSGETIEKETRFTHVPSAQRCLTDLPDGWWNTFELPPDLQDNVTEILDVGGSPVDLINAEPIHEEFTRWMFDRYIEAGIGLPEVAAVWFPPAPECDLLGGLAIEADERYAGRHTVVICFEEDRLPWDDSASGWNPSAASYGLHELAHIWMVDRLTDGVRDAFNKMTGLEVWRGSEVEWAQRGVEQAAFTIPWAITDRTEVNWPIFWAAPCTQLADRYRLLTGHEPLRKCEAEES